MRPALLTRVVRDGFAYGNFLREHSTPRRTPVGAQGSHPAAAGTPMSRTREMGRTPFGAYGPVDRFPTQGQTATTSPGSPLALRCSVRHAGRRAHGLR